MKLTDRGRIFFVGYVIVVCVLAVALTAPALSGLPDFLRHPAAGYVLMFGLAVLCDLPPLRGAGPVPASVCFSFAALLTWGLAPAVLVQTGALLAASGYRWRRPWRIAYTASRYVLGLVAASIVLGAVSGTVGVLLAALAWFATAQGSEAGAARLRHRGYRWIRLEEALAVAAVLLLGPALATAGARSPALIPFVVVPLCAVSRLTRLIRIDPLTGLLNRRAMEDELAWRVGTADGFALCLLDLDRFRRVNDALGHRVGDRLLTAVAGRLREAAKGPDVVARLGGDEFAVLTPNAGRAWRFARVLAEPVVVDGLPLDVGGAIGVACYPDHGTDVATLLRHAEVAMYDAKSRADSVAPYRPESDHNSPERLSLLADLRRALESPDAAGLTFHYQPQVDTRSGAVIGVEALLRWCHPRRGPVDPEELIRVAEHSTVMRLLTGRVIDEVVAQLGSWAAAGVRLRASINVSVRDLHSTEVVDRLAARLSAHAVGSDQIQLEITEGALMADPRRVLVTLRRLAGLGVALSLDDFGTGYSSMQHLRRLPLAEVKIDRSFVLGMAADPDDEAIVRSIIELAGALGLRVVAEGVEDEHTFRLLATNGCHAAQGWYHGRPMPADELVSWMASYRPGAVEMA